MRNYADICIVSCTRPRREKDREVERGGKVILLKEEFIFCTINFCPHKFEAESINPDRER